MEIFLTLTSLYICIFLLKIILIAGWQKDLSLPTVGWIILKGYPVGKDCDNFMNWLCFLFILQCKCWPGFQLKDDGKTCVDVDECSTGFPCSQQCINTYGTYKCLCTDGYEIQPDNPNGCKSLSGMDLNLSTDQLPLHVWILHFLAIFTEFIPSCYILEINILLYVPWCGVLSFWFCVLSMNCSVCNNTALWPCKLLSVFLLCF